MQVPPDLLKCVCFVERRSASERKLNGTAFLVSKPLVGVRPAVDLDPHMVYAVTATHVLKDDSGDPWDGIRLCLNTKDGYDFIDAPFEMWVPHPTSDTSVLPLIPDQAYFDYMHYPADSYVDTEFFVRHELTPGDEVIVTGLLWAHPGSPHLTPIVRVGHVASFPVDPIAMDAPTGHEGGILIEVLSFGGLSGSPAFLHLGDFRREDHGRGELVALQGKVGPTGGNWLLGIVQGRFRSIEPHRYSSEPLNVGITAVVPAARIIEIVDSPDFVRDREDRVKELNDGGPKTERTSLAAPSEAPESEYERFDALTRQLANTPKPKPDEKPS